MHHLGLYIGKIESGEIRLSIEGSQLIGPTAKKNVLEITEKQVRNWLRGQNLETNSKQKAFVILKHKKDFLGSGKMKKGKVINSVPKIRRIKSQD